jgi:hypothetical protein
MTNDNTPALALIGLSLCEAASKLDAWSRALFLASFLALLLGVPVFDAPHVIMTATCLMCAGGEDFFAWRLAFDRPIFAAWARLDKDRLTAAQRAFDAALGNVWGKNR